MLCGFCVSCFLPTGRLGGLVRKEGDVRGHVGVSMYLSCGTEGPCCVWMSPSRVPQSEPDGSHKARVLATPRRPSGPVEWLCSTSYRSCNEMWTSPGQVL
ncbi:uncharacterized protein LOC144910319 isoform X4 [Branchiostoma floridae x Branchiostoma belcheri]